MFTELEIKVTPVRCFIEFHFDGTRVRVASGKILNLNISPNRAKTDSNKSKLLERLKYELQKALERGWNPFVKEEQKIVELTVEKLITQTLKSKLNSQLSRTYKRDLSLMSEKLLQFLLPAEKTRTLDKLTPARISEFMEQFNTSNGNYMNKRKTLNVLLPVTTKNTQTKRTSESLHSVYTKKQLTDILKFLKTEHPKLHLLALLIYGCLLRPHEEARLLQKKNIFEKTILLSGFENKGKRVRIIPIPEYVYKELTPYIYECKTEESYIFTGTNWLLNDYYFNTLWGRAKIEMKKLGLLQENQTLYSFRHTAAVNVYRKTKDVYLVQKMLGHGSVVVTLKYLRGLGEVDVEELRNAAPEL